MPSSDNQPHQMARRGRIPLADKDSHNRYVASMNSSQAKRFLARSGCTFSSGKGGHLVVRRGSRKSILPQHGGSKQLGTGLWKKILKDLELDEKE
jgi:mRNA interferase HicA